MTHTPLYRTLWRWHFYAGLFVLPFLVTLSLSGALYLFKPQIDRWEERAFHGQPGIHAVTPHQQVEAVMTAYAGAVLLDYRLPEQADDAALIRIALASGEGVREVFVAPDGTVLGAIEPDTRIMAVVKRFHSELLIGKAGNWLVELAASWAIVLLLSGLYLWWPRGRDGTGILWPRQLRQRRILWRDLHVVIGFWIAGLALALLLTGLPWTSVWGSAFKTVRVEMGWVKGAPTWAIDGTREADHAHDHAPDGGAHPAPAPSFSLHTLDAMVAKARAEPLPFPAIVTPPGAPGRFGQPGQMAWTIRSDAPAPRSQTIRYDLEGQTELSRERFADGHPIDRVVGYGIAWHEGQLFGWVNQLVGVLTALGLTTLAVAGFFSWRHRKPAGRLGAPSPAARWPVGAAIILFAALLLPLLALSLVLVWLLEQLLLRRVPRLADWLGVPQ